ncbi:MAG: SDR family NAD(P)-dependent oxidoreductase [Deltaproteobacteria bacterium]|nr:SDR family NAD(P)-dependent oxidoreductase [Deltaproteobacteria bacterium]
MGGSSRVAGRVIVVTGASRGFGLALGSALAKRGARVVLSSRTSTECEAAAAALREEGHDVTACVCDVRDRSAVQALGEAAIARYGGLDVWINNAGTSAPYGPVREVPESAFLSATRTLIDGVYFGSKTALSHFAGGDGMLVNIVGRGERSPVALQAAYASAKAWVRNFTLALAAEERSRGLAILAFQPGLMDTRLVLEPVVLPSYEHRMGALAIVSRLFGAAPELAAEALVRAIAERRSGYLAAHPWWWMLVGPLRLLTGARPARPIRARVRND